MRITTKETHDGIKFVLTVDAVGLLALARYARESGEQYEKVGALLLANEAYEMRESMVSVYDTARFEYGSGVSV